jgi:hypothetical protein
VELRAWSRGRWAARGVDLAQLTAAVVGCWQRGDLLGLELPLETGEEARAVTRPAMTVARAALRVRLAQQVARARRRWVHPGSGCGPATASCSPSCGAGGTRDGGRADRTAAGQSASVCALRAHCACPLRPWTCGCYRGRHAVSLYAHDQGSLRRMPLERRLTPINGFIGLCRPAPPWPSTLADAGFWLAALEVPVRTEVGTVTLDGVAHAPATNELLVTECKSGANVDVDQAQKLALLQAESVVRSASITLTSKAEPKVEVIYLCLEGQTDRIVLGLEIINWPGAVLELSATHLRLAWGRITLPSLSDRFSAPIPLSGPPPGFVTIDPESPDESFDRIVIATLVECQANRLPMVTIRSLTERAIPHLAFFGRAAKGAIERKVSQAARRIAEQTRENYVFQPSSENREAAVRIVRTPEDADPRGRTQAYQALARRGGEPRRRPRAEVPGQARLFESLLQELEADDESDEEEGGDDRE